MQILLLLVLTTTIKGFEDQHIYYDSYEGRDSYHAPLIPIVDPVSYIPAGPQAAGPTFSGSPWAPAPTVDEYNAPEATDAPSSTYVLKGDTYGAPLALPEHSYEAPPAQTYGAPSVPAPPAPSYGAPPTPTPPAPTYGAPSVLAPPAPSYGGPSFPVDIYPQVFTNTTTDLSFLHLPVSSSLSLNTLALSLISVGVIFFWPVYIESLGSRRRKRDVGIYDFSDMQYLDYDYSRDSYAARATVPTPPSYTGPVATVSTPLVQVNIGTIALVLLAGFTLVFWPTTRRVDVNSTTNDSFPFNGFINRIFGLDNEEHQKEKEDELEFSRTDFLSNNAF